MIEITHQTAQRIIREGLDRAIPNEQWSALQAHLERCAECSAFRAGRLALERDLRRSLRGRWASAEGRVESAPLARRIRRKRAARERMQKALGSAGLALLALLVLGGFVLYRRAAAPPPDQVVATLPPLGGGSAAEPAPTVTPTAAPGQSLYQGVVAVEAQAGGNAAPTPLNKEIFLLEAGPQGSQLTNLTDNPADDSEPVWSPDGQWIAFLSDRERAKGQTDIYVISIAGTRLTRLTADPNLTWRGPLAWSPDGGWIAAEGVPVSADPNRSAGAGFLYRVSLAGQPPRPLPGSRGGYSPRFAPGRVGVTRGLTPFGPLLAYAVQEGPLAYLRVYNAATNETVDITRGEAAQGGRAGPGALTLTAFDWTPFGESLVYITSRAEPQRDPFAVEVRLALLYLSDGNTAFRLESGPSTSYPLLSAPSFAPILSAAMTPQGDLLYTRTYRKDGQWVECTPLMADTSTTPNQNAIRATPLGPLALPVLCVNSPLDRSAWSADGQLLVTAAHSTTEDDPGIYAFLFPAGGPGQRQGEDGSNMRVVRSARLADLPPGTSALRPRPGLAGIDPIDPQPAHPPADGTAARLPADLLRSALVVVKQGDSFGIAHLGADGSPARVMGNAWGGFCMQVDPAGEQIAFAAIGEETGPGGSELYTMPLDGRERFNVTRLSDLYDLFSAVPQSKMSGQYGCPAWSPDGARLAAWVTISGRPYLVVIPRSGQPPEEGHYFGLEPAGYKTPPIWLPDNRHVLVFIRSPRDGLYSLSAVDASTGSVIRLALSDGWDAVSAAALSPDGSLLAFTAEQSNGVPGSVTKLYLTGPNGDPVQPPRPLLSYGHNSYGYTRLQWLAPGSSQPGPGDGRADQRLGLVLRGSADGRLPSALLLYDPVTSRQDTLIELGEEITSAAFSPDGEWALYSTPGGLWALSIRGALEGYAAPLWVASVRAYEIAW